MIIIYGHPIVVMLLMLAVHLKVYLYFEILRNADIIRGFLECYIFNCCDIIVNNSYNTGVTSSLQNRISDFQRSKTTCNQMRSPQPVGHGQYESFPHYSLLLVDVQLYSSCSFLHFDTNPHAYSNIHGAKIRCVSLS